MIYRGVLATATDGSDGGWIANLSDGQFLCAGSEAEYFPSIMLSIDQLLEEIIEDEDIVQKRFEDRKEAEAFVTRQYQVPEDVATAALNERWGIEGAPTWA